MRTHAQFDPKCDSLRQHATLNPHPEQVSDALFQTNLFFDPRDLLQVKYEMLRRVVIDGQPIGTTAAAFGFSRITLSQLRKRFEADGLAGLLPQPKGPRQAHKLSDDILTFILQTLKAEPELRTANLSLRINQHFGISIHLRSIQRALARQRKKDCRSMRHPSRCVQLPLDRGPSVWLDTKFCAARYWSLAMTPIPMAWNWHSSSARGWQLGWNMGRTTYRPALSRPICRYQDRGRSRLQATPWFWLSRTWS
jgi:transposase